MLNLLVLALGLLSYGRRRNAILRQDGRDLLLRALKAQSLHCDFQFMVINVAIFVQVEELECLSES